ncbi:copper resistance CopC/CopD family protein [Halopiger djelfimassiliensis]|uniref:copper resistance CopC/CopD family protein n=1 Tax=Halopiger djelfimassiliensis TaxID=1293047 RepID=UPI000677947B|nr:copper resistance protein CopC [Halopiger djelfimassiliensis]
MIPGESLARDPRGRSPPAWVPAVLAVAVLVLTGVAAPVAAHASLSDSDPENGARLETRPAEATLTFAGDGIQTADVAVLDPDGEDVSREARVDPDDAQLVRVPLEPGPTDGQHGLYTVEWEVFADDGHTTSGSFVFTVGDGPLDRDAVLETYRTEGGGADEGTPLPEAGAKGLVLLAIAGLVGLPATAAVAVYPVATRFDSPTRTVDRLLARSVAGTSAILFASVLALGLARAASLGPLAVGTVREFVATALGRVWLVQLGLAAALAVALVSIARDPDRRSRRGRLGTALVGALAVGALGSWTSHSATAIDRLWGLAADFAHVVGAGLWLGGLFVLAVVVPPMLRGTAAADRRAAAAETIRRYSLLALAGVTLAGATGLTLASWHVPALEDLAGTGYGRTLSAKTLLVLLALGLGGGTRFVLLRRLETGADRSAPIVAFTRAVRLEVALLAVVVLLSGLLASVPTAAVVAGGDHGLETATVERTDDDTVVELAATPAATVTDRDATGDRRERLLVAENTPLVFEVAFSSGAGGDPVASDRPVRLLATAVDGDATIEVELEETNGGTYATVQRLPADGDWELRITGAPDGDFDDWWIDARVADDRTASDDTARSDGNDPPLPIWLRFGAVAIAVVGTAAVVLEAVRFGD